MNYKIGDRYSTKQGKLCILNIYRTTLECRVWEKGEVEIKYIRKDEFKSYLDE